MPHRVRIAQLIFAVCLISWGLLHFIAGECITGRSPAWPAEWPGKLLFAYSTGVLLVLVGVILTMQKKAMEAAACVGIFILLWAGLRNIFELVNTLDHGATLTNTNKALTIGFGSLLIAATYRNANTSSPKSFLELCVDRLAPLAKYFVGAFLLISGVQHFLFAEFVKFLIPTWIPLPVFWSYFSGVALAAAGLGIITNIQRKRAAFVSACMIFSWVILLHLPRALGADGNTNEWIAVFEALATSVFLFLIASDED